MARRALVVRGGWQGHHPVEATDEFIPDLESNGFSVRVEEDSTAVYADAAYMTGVDLVVQTAWPTWRSPSVRVARTGRTTGWPCTSWTSWSPCTAQPTRAPPSR